MIDRQALLSDLQSLLRRLEADLLERSESTEIPDVERTLRAEYERAKKAERTAQNYEDWRSDAITQAAAAWVLSCVFVRFLEDNRLIDPPKIAGPKERLQQARDEHTLYFQDSERAKLTDREYLLAVFDELAKLPGTKDVFGEHNPIRELPNWLSGDAAGELLRFFQKIDANTGNLIHDFTDPEWDTRFLGDLYQDLSEAARKKYALLQTPEFVEEFILDRTLDPALEEFGLDAPPVTDKQGKPITEPGFRMIDPACGSGHFLLGSLRRLLERWGKKDPDAKLRIVTQRALDSIYGVDVNPYAVAIARFRLLLVALKECGVMKLALAPDFQIHVVCGDSLLHAPLRGGQHVLDFELTPGSEKQDEECEHAYGSEDLPELKRMLRAGQYHAVVANPPYITPKDRQLNQRYRKRFESCHMKYSLAVPFMENLFRLAVQGKSLTQRRKDAKEEADRNDLCASAPLRESSGFVGQITANSFMKREFGKKLIESFLPKIDLTYVIDTSGAYIPGHGTPTVILFGRNRAPVTGTIRAVMGIRGEPSTPDDPARGLVWSAIIEQIDQPGSQSEFVSVGDSERERFHAHPWSIGGGGAAELKERLEEGTTETLSARSLSIGITSFTLEDDIYILPDTAACRSRLGGCDFREMVVGDVLRDWTKAKCEVAVFPYDNDFQPIVEDINHPSQRYLWIARTCLANNKMFGGKTKVETGLKWYEYGRLTADKLRTPLSIVYGEVATHNHFVLDHGGRVFNRTAPVIKLPPDANEDDHLALLGLLNSSTACFWMKQVCFPKGTSTGDISKEKGKSEANRYAFNATAIGGLPIPNWSNDLRQKVIWIARSISARADRATHLLSGDHLGKLVAEGGDKSLKEQLAADRGEIQQLKGEMVALQEDLDWTLYAAFDLTSENLTHTAGDECPTITAACRPFRISKCPSNATEGVQRIWKLRCNAIHNNPSIALIETPVFKRPWTGRQGVYGSSSRTIEESQCDLQHDWLLSRLESYFDFDGRMSDQVQPTAKLDVALNTVAKLADVARQDPQFMEVGEVYRDDAAFDVQRLVEELVQAEHVPLLPALRYKPAGLRKRKEWEKTWELQRREDAIDARTQLPTDDPRYLTEDHARDLKQREIGDIPVPPKYQSSDFISAGGARYWALRGKLDVPKERWVSFPHCEGPDGTLVIAWAGYDHLQLARAISAYFVDIQERLGGRDDPRLVPLLACIIELLPWLRQWHHDLDHDYNQRMDEVFEGFVTEEAKNLGLTIDEIKAWEPPKKSGRSKTKTKA